MFAKHALLAALAAALPFPSALAQPMDAILRHLRQAHPGCDIHNPRQTYRGHLEGSAAPVVFVAYTFEGCHGNDWRAVFGLFREEHGRVLALAVTSLPRWPVHDVRVANGVIRATGLDYGPNDPRCCPTIRRGMTYVVRNDAVVPAR